MFDRDTVRTLLSPAGEEVLAAAARLESGLTGLSRLRRAFPADLATLAHLTVELRRKATPRFRHADRMFFLPEALEQATGDVIALHKGRRFADRPHVADLGCGVGGDLIGLHAVTAAIGIDRDPIRLAMARANLAAYGSPHPTALVCADLVAAAPRASAFHWDPARRQGGRRVRRGDRFEPPLSVLSEVLARVPDGAVCVGPMTDEREIPAGVDGEWEAISLGGECRALVLWTGDFRTAPRRATRLPEGISLTGDGRPADASVPIADAETASHLVVPDPAVVRAHLVTELAAAENATFLDPHLALLAAERPVVSPWVRTFAVRAAFPFSRRRLRKELAAHALGRVQFSRHGVAIRESDLADCTRASGPVEARVFLVRGDRGVTAYLTAPEPVGRPT